MRKHKFLSAFLSAALAIGCVTAPLPPKYVPSSANIFTANAENIEKIEVDSCTLTFTMYADHAELYSCISTKPDTTLMIPDEVNGVEVTDICANAFQNQSLYSVIMPDSVCSIGKSAFQNSKIERITLSQSLIVIGDYAFYEATNLKTITIPDTVTDIGSFAFTYCDSLSSIEVGTKNRYYCSEDGVLFDKNKKHLIAYGNSWLLLYSMLANLNYYAMIRLLTPLTAFYPVLYY